MSKILKTTFALLLLTTLFLTSCDCGKEDRLFYEKTEVLDIKRDDDGELHLLLKYENGRVVSLPDIHSYNLFMNDSIASAELPFVEWENCNNKGVLSAWRTNSTDYSNIAIRIHVPKNYEITLFND